MNAKNQIKLLKRTLKKVLKTGVSNDQEDLIENTFIKVNQCLHSGYDCNRVCVRCGKRLKKNSN